MTDVLDIRLLKFSDVGGSSHLSNPEAGCVNGQGVLPYSPDVSATLIEFLRQAPRYEFVLCMQKAGMTLALHPPPGGSQADIGAIKVKVGQIVVKTKTR